MDSMDHHHVVLYMFHNKSSISILPELNEVLANSNKSNCCPLMDADCNGANVLDFLQHVMQDIGIGETLEDRNWLISFYKRLKKCSSRSVSNSLDFTMTYVRFLKILIGHSSVETLLKATFITISDLREVDGTGISCSLHTDEEPKALSKRNMLLFGKLTSSPSFGKSTVVSGQLYLQDNAGSVICELTKATATNCQSILDQLVFVTSWNFIKRNGRGHIEVTGTFLPVHQLLSNSVPDDVMPSGADRPLPSCLKTLCALSAEDTAELIKHREMKITTLNFCGTVTAISEIIRVKRDFLFLIQVSDDEDEDPVNIVIKDKKYLYWQKLIVPQQQYAFTGLRPTTMQQGAGNGGQRILIPWSDSCVFLAEQCSLRILPLESWLSVNGYGVKPLAANLEIHSSKPESSKQKLMSYQGTITNCDQAHNGIYELDEKIRLYVTFVPAIHRYEVLRLGSRVVVHNAHQRGSSQPPKIRLCCCMRSCIKVAEFSTQCSPSIPFSPTFSPVAEMCYKKNLSMIQLNWLLDLKHALCKKLKKTCDRKYIEELTYLIGSFVINNHDTSRNLVQEFLSGSHDCCPMRRSSASLCEVPLMSTVISAAEAKLNDLRDQIEAYAGQPLKPHELDDLLYWNYNIEFSEFSQKLLIGWLELSPMTGHIQFCDNSGCLPIVVTSNMDDHEHSCKQNSCHQRIQEGMSLCCPYFNLSQVRAFVYVKHWQVVRERFMITNYPTSANVGDNRYIQRRRHHVYLQFSMKDCVVLDRNQKQSETKDSDSQKEDLPRKRIRLNTDKEMPTSNDMTDTNSFVAQHFLLTHKEYLFIQNRICNEPNLRFSAIGCFIGEPHMSEPARIETNISGKTDSIRHVILVFTGDAVQWYHGLRAGCVYRLMHNSDSIHVFHSNFSTSALKNVVKKSNTRECIMLPSNIKITLASHQDLLTFNPLLKRVTEYDSGICLMSIKEIREERYVGKLVNFRGTIFSRQHPVAEIFQGQKGKHAGNVNGDAFQKINAKLGVAVLDNRSISLVVQDTASPSDEIQVFLNLNQSSYPLGLLPRAIVEFQRLERKISRRGLVYCQHVAVSVVTVISSPGDATQKMCVDSKRSVGDSKPQPLFQTAPSRFLSDVWTAPSFSQPFMAICQTMQLRNLSLKTVCVVCAGMYERGHCADPACQPGAGYKMVARVSVIVEDSTSSAMALCRGDLVRMLLDLMPIQWQKLEEEISKQGEVYMQQSGDRGSSDVETFLSILCESPIIKRTWRMRLLAKNVPDVNTMSKADFTVKSVDFGGMRYDTSCLPFNQLECLAIENVNISDMVMKEFTSFREAEKNS